jgi:Domain of unknown function (DUF4160)
VQLTALRAAADAKQRRLVEAWAELHEAELMADWQRSQAGQKPLPMAPLS